MKVFNSRFTIPQFATLNRADGGDGAGSNGEGGTPPASGGGEGGTKAELVAKADHDRALADLHKYKSEALALKKERETEKANKMKADNQWKELAEANELKAREAAERAEKIQNSYLGEKKFNAIQSKCQALGLRPEAVADLELLDLEAVQVETTSTGKINILGADKFAERLKTLKPHWFAEKSTTTVNTNGTRVVDKDGAITPADILKAEKEAHKTGDKSKYNDLFKKYQQQRATR